MPRPKLGARVLCPPSAERGGWRLVRVADNGKRKSEFFPTERQRDRAAERARSEIAGAKSKTIGEAFDDYVKFLEAKDVGTERTGWAIEVFFAGVTYLSELTPARCEGLYESLRTRPRTKTLKDGTVKTYPPYAADSHRGALREAKTFLRWCVRQGYLPENPAEKIEGVGRLRPRGKSLGADGVDLTIVEARAWYAKAVELSDAGDAGATAALVALLCGLRSIEVVTRRARHLDTDQFPGDVLHVPAAERKNRKAIRPEVPEVLRPALVALATDRDPMDFLFAADTESGHQCRHWVRRSARRICRLAGVPSVTAHGLRGMLATVAGDRGIAGHVIAATLGNDERVMRRSYAAPGSLEAGERRRGLAVLNGGRK